MNETVTRFKWFWAHEDEEQEAWLRAQARQGLHLVDVNPFCVWTFRVGEPADIVYRLDFSSAARDGDFRQLMQDTGWTLAATTVGWQYWTTPAVNGKAPEIFTDNASKAQKFQRVLTALLTSAMPVFLWFVLFGGAKVLARLSLPFLVPIAAVMAIYLLTVPYAIVRLLIRLRQVRGPLPA